MQGFAVDPVYAKGEVFAYVGLPQNLKDLKDYRPSVHGVQAEQLIPSSRTTTGARCPTRARLPRGYAGVFGE